MYSESLYNNIRRTLAMPVVEQSESPQGRPKWERFHPPGNVISYAGDGQLQAAKYNYLRVVKPDRRRKPSGWLFPLPYEYHRESRTSCAGIVTKHYDGYSDRWFNGPVGSYLPNSNMSFPISGTPWDWEVLPPLSAKAVAEHRALLGFKTRGREMESSFNVGVAWAERKQTASLLSSTGNTIAKALLALGRRDIMGAGRALGIDRKTLRKLSKVHNFRDLQKAMRGKGPAALTAAAAAWLALQMGWKPLLSDVYSAAEALAYRDSYADWVVTSVGKYKLDREDVRNININPTWAYKNADAVLSAFSKVRVKVRLDATVDSNFFQKLGSLGLTNPVFAVYEATPFSFLWDYFFTTGEWLESIGATAGFQFYSGSCTRYGEYLASHEPAAPDSSNRWFGTRRIVHWKREVYTGFPFPISPFEMKPESLNLNQVLNMLSLLALAVGKFGVKTPRIDRNVYTD